MTIKTQGIPALIHAIRGKKVKPDSDLAALYRVDAKVFNQAVKRNAGRLPEGFRLQLTQEDHSTRT